MRPNAAPPPPAMPWWLAALIVSAAALGPFALNVFVPSMPGMIRLFETDALHVQLTLTLYLIGLAVAQLFYGPLSDRFGRRPVLIGGLTIYVLAGSFCAAAQSIEMLIAGRVFQAVGACAGVVLGRAIVRDLFSHERAASMLAYLSMVMSIAPAIAPAIGGYLDVWFGWRAGFVLLVGLGSLALTVAVLRLPETNRHRQAMPGLAGMLSGYAMFVRSRAYVGYALCMACSAGVFFGFLAGAPFITVDLLRRPPSDYGLGCLLVSGGYVFGAFLAGRLSARVGSRRMMAIGVTITLAGCSAQLVAALSGWLDITVLFAPMAVIGVGNGLSQPNCIAAALSVNPRAAGAAAGLAGFLQMATGALATVLIGRLQDGTQFPMVGVMLAAAAASALAYLAAVTAPAPEARSGL